MQEALADLKAGRTPTRRVEFAAIRELVGFAGYDEILARYDAGRGADLAVGAPPADKGSDHE